MRACTMLPKASIRYSGRVQRRRTGMPGLPGLLNAIFRFSALARNEIRSQPSPFAAKSLGHSLGRGSDPRFDPLARHAVACPPATGAGSFEFEGGERIKAFEPSLYLWATVMSRPAGDRAIVDAGLEALAFDSGTPLVCDEPAATYERASDEHGRLAVSAATDRLGLGDKIRLIPGPPRPDCQSLRLVCLRARQPRRADLADHRPRCGLLIASRSVDRSSLSINRL
jgi:Putative serine dehydratase domain